MKWITNKATKILLLSLSLFMYFFVTKLPLHAASDLVLKIYNWEDYIDEGSTEEKRNSVIEDWIKDYKDRTNQTVSVVYDTFETNENMLNTLKTGKTTYDLVCPSEYTIQKMIADDMLEKMDYENGSYKYVPNFNTYGSKYLQDLFVKENMAEYAIPYMWGTLGLVYNPEVVSDEDATTWDILWNENYKNQATAKDSVRDTYIVGVIHVYYDTLMELRKQFDEHELTKEEYNKQITEIMNRVDDETIHLVKEDLLRMRNNIYGFEVDNGKSDITTGRISINFAWSGDAVFAIDSAEEDTNGEMQLKYSVPEEGSNVWFDGWVMPKGANKTLAQDFLNFLCQPEIAARNMDTIGYTSSIAGNAIWELANDWYGAEDGEEVDLTYFFEGTLDDEYLTDGKAIIKVAERGRQFDAQYPTEDVISRCVVMAAFGEQNDKVLTMWKEVRSGIIPVAVIVLVFVFHGILIAGLVFYRKFKKSKHRHIERNEEKI